MAQLCQDYDGDYTEVNKQLDKMGYNIGLRLIEDFLARSNVGRCVNFRETADMVAKVGLELQYDNGILCGKSNCFNMDRSGSRCSSISRRRSRTGQATTTNSPSSSKKTHWQTLWNYPMMDDPKTNCGSPISCVVSSAVHLRW